MKFKDQITGAIGLLAPNHDAASLSGIFDEYDAFAEAIKDEQYEGAAIAEQISSEDKVVKELEGPHLEVSIVVNTVSGMTVDQEYVREVTDGVAQVFAVDAWRMREIAETLYPQDEAKQQKAYLSMLVYTLATAGTLTKDGDLPSTY